MSDEETAEILTRCSKLKAERDAIWIMNESRKAKQAERTMPPALENI